MNVDGLVIEDADDAADQHFHELLRVGNLSHLLRNPQTTAHAVVIGEGHAVGEDVIKLGNRFPGKEGYPLAAFPLQSYKTGLAFHAGQEIQHPGVRW